MIKIYSIATDITSQSVGLSGLEEDIKASNITIAIKSIHVVGDVLTIEFKADLSGAEQTTLDAVVLAHDGHSVTIIETIEMKPILAEGGKRKTDRGFNFTVTAGTTHTHDYLVSNDLQIKGGVMYTDNNHIKDQVSLEIVDTAFLYAGDWYPAEYAPGVPWSVATPDGVPLHMYVGNFPVAKGGVSTFDNDAITTTPLNGLTIRITYKSIGVTDVECSIGIVAYT